MKETAGAESSAAALRRAFDRSFSLPLEEASQEVDDLLSVRIAGDPFAIRLRDIAGVIGRRTIVSVPAAAPGLLGLAGIRGDLVPVFGLSPLMGYGDDGGSPTWIILCRGQEPIGLGFSELEGYLRAPRSALHAGEALDSIHSTRRYIDRIAATDAGPLPVLGIHRVVAAIRSRLGGSPPQKDQ